MRLGSAPLCIGAQMTTIILNAIIFFEVHPLWMVVISYLFVAITFIEAYSLLSAPPSEEREPWEPKTGVDEEIPSQAGVWQEQH